MSFESLLVPTLASDPEGIWVLIPLAAIAGGAACIIVKAIINHRERMAKIGMGIDPDAPSKIDPMGSGGSRR
jgi:hypothetical protein